MDEARDVAGRLYPRGRASLPADRLLASDPGLKRLRNACRTMLAVVCAAALSSPVAIFGGVVVAPLFGGLVALLSTMAVRDETLGGRKITTLLLFLPASLAVTAGGLLSEVLWAQWLALSVIVFFAFYLRRFGTRYVALGLMAAILYVVSVLVSSFIGFEAGQLPWIYAAIAAGAACGYLARFYLLPDNPESVLRRSISAFDIQLAITLEAITDTLTDRRNDDDRGKRLRREADRLHERVVAVESELLAEEADVSRQRSDWLRLRLFDSEMSANTLAEIVWRDAGSDPALPANVRERLLRALGELYLTLRQSFDPAQTIEALEEMERARAGTASGGSGDGHEAWSFQTRRAYAAIRQLAQGAGEDQEEGPDSAGEDQNESEEEDEKEDEQERSEPRNKGISAKLRPTTVQGIQATVAVSLALAAGQVFSPSRPYWVVIIAFVVFIGSGTLSDTLSKSFQRSAGTVGGAVAGLLLVGLISGNLYLEVALIAVCAFLAFYVLTLSQTLMMFWITVILAAVFDIAGLLGGGILTLRVFDTLLGSAIGLAVSALVLPTKPSDEFRGAVADFLDSLEGYVSERVRWLAGGEAKRHPVERAREVQSKLDTVVGHARTARRQAMVFGRSRSDFDHWMTGLLALSYYARHLAGPVGRRQRLPEDSLQSELLRQIGDAITSNIGSLREALSEHKDTEIRDIEDLMRQLENETGESEKTADSAGLPRSISPQPYREGPANALHYLRRINRTLGELSSEPAIGGPKKSVS